MAIETASPLATVAEGCGIAPAIIVVTDATQVSEIRASRALRLKLRSAITAIRRRQDLDVSEVVRVRDYAKAAAVRSGACPESAYFACIADHLARWLASRPKAEPVNAELLEAARAWYRGGIERGYSFSFPTQLRLIDAIARADAASKGKTGEELPKPDPAVTREWVRELVARAMEYDGPEDTPTYIRAGKCDPEVK